jgi:hypothetical protein
LFVLFQDCSLFIAPKRNCGWICGGRAVNRSGPDLGCAFAKGRRSERLTLQGLPVHRLPGAGAEGGRLVMEIESLDGAAEG